MILITYLYIICLPLNHGTFWILVLAAWYSDRFLEAMPHNFTRYHVCAYATVTLLLSIINPQNDGVILNSFYKTTCKSHESPWHPVAHTMKLTDRFFHAALMQKSGPSLGAAHCLHEDISRPRFVAWHVCNWYPIDNPSFSVFSIKAGNIRDFRPT